MENNTDEEQKKIHNQIVETHNKIQALDPETSGMEGIETLATDIERNSQNIKKKIMKNEALVQEILQEGAEDLKQDIEDLKRVIKMYTEFKQKYPEREADYKKYIDDLTKQLNELENIKKGGKRRKTNKRKQKKTNKRKRKNKKTNKNK
jgi:chromosome segregation ATPase